MRAIARKIQQTNKFIGLDYRAMAALYLISVN